MNVDNKRLLMELDRQVKRVNRETINPQIEVLTIEQLRPVLEMVARARADYLKTFFEAGANCDGLPDMERCQALKQKREVFEELIAASHALHIAIENGYLDVADSPSSS
ncbi:MAG: hypothetical protein KDJ38_15675 [Gammaproteobacteria bacterium]|nr:hypothetical protein [Gammaproteobacteria bacterium]